MIDIIAKHNYTSAKQAWMEKNCNPTEQPLPPSDKAKAIEPAAETPDKIKNVKQNTTRGDLFLYLTFNTIRQTMDPLAPPLGGIQLSSFL